MMTSCENMDIHLQPTAEGETILQDILTWGLSSRDPKLPPDPISPKKSPINVPFQLCKAFKVLRKQCRKRKRPHQSPTLLEKSSLPQDQYMDVLSMPPCCLKSKKKPRRRRRKRKCCKRCTCCKNNLPTCRPRIIQMAIPNKRYVLENWKAFQHFLPAEMLMRFDQILKSGDNLEPSIARCYFKQLQRKRRQELRRLKKLKRKKKDAKRRGEMRWLKEQINDLVDTIVEHIDQSPLLVLNFQQMMTSNELLHFFTSKRVIRVRKRTTKDVYKRTLIEISDKLIKWMDTANFYADIQPLDSKEMLGAVVKMPSMESILAEEMEEGEEVAEIEAMLKKLQQQEEEAEEEGEREAAPGALEVEGEEASLAEKGGDEEGVSERFEAKKLLDKAKEFGKYEDEDEEGSLMDFLGRLDEDMLEKLIKILSDSSPEFLLQEFDGDAMPGVTYADVLEKLKEIRDGNLMAQRKEKLALEERMIEWAKTNKPEQVDDKLLDKIHETSMILAEWFKDSDMAQMLKPGEKKRGKGARWGEGEEGEGEEGEGDGEGLDAEKRRRGEDEGEEGEGEGDEDQAGGRKSGKGGEMEGEGEEWKEYGESEGISDSERQRPSDKSIRSDVDDEEKTLTEGAGTEEKSSLLESDLMDEEGEGWEDAGRESKRKGRGSETGESEDLSGESEEFSEEGEDEEEGTESLRGGEKAEGSLLGEAEEAEEAVREEMEKLSSLLEIIRGHKPSKMFEHAPGTICCLSLKIWAVWLLKIAHNAHNWTRWVGDIIRQIRQYAAIIRGDVKSASGETQVLYKAEWRKFVKDAEEKIVAWRQYSKHVKDLSKEIMENFHGKKVSCCPKCLQDHLIKNVVTAHETLEALTEAINCAGYWQRCLDTIVEQTSKFTEIDFEAEKTEAGSEDSCSLIEIEELSRMPASKRALSESSYDSILEIEELEVPRALQNYEILEMEPPRPQPQVFQVELLREPEEVAVAAPAKPVEKAKSGKKSAKAGKKR